MIAGTLEIQMMANMARLAEDMRVAKSTVTSAMDSIEKSVASAKMALGALGIGMSAMAFVEFIRSSIDAAQSLHDLAIQAQMTGAALSGLKEIGRTSKTSVEDIASAADKMAKSLSGGGASSATAVAALGLNISKLKSEKPDQAMLDIAKAMDGFADGQSKAAVAMALFGKNGAALLPFMKDLAEAGAIHATMTQAQIDKADDLADRIDKLPRHMEAMQRTIGLSVLPTFGALLSAITDVDQEASAVGTNATIEKWASHIGQALAAAYDIARNFGIAFLLVSKSAAMGFYDIATAAQMAKSIVNPWQKMGDDLPRLAAERNAFAKQFMTDMADTVSSSKAGWTALDAFNKKLDELNGPPPHSDKANKKTLNYDPKAIEDAAAALKKQTEEYKSLTAEVTKFASAQSFLSTQSEKLTAGQSLALSVMEKIRDATVQLTTKQKIALGLKLEYALGVEKSNLAIAESEKAFEARAKEVSQKVIADYKAQQDALHAYENEWDHYLGGLEQAIKTLTDQSDLYGLTATQIAEVNLQRSEETVQIAKTNGVSTDYILHLQREVDLRKQILDKTKVLEQKTAWSDLWKSVDSAAHDAFIHIFDQGKSIFDRLTEALKTGLLDLLYQMTVKKWVIAISASTTAGVAGAAGASDVGSIVNGTGNWLSSASSIYSGITNGFESLSTSITGMTQGLMNSFNGVHAPMLAAQNGNFAAGVGTAGSYIGAGMAGITIGSMIAGNKSVIGLDGTTTAALGAAIGSAFGPVGTLVGGVLGGAFNAAFGMGPKVMGTTTLAGSFNASGFGGAYQTPWQQDGGWFRSDRSGINTTPLGADQQTALTNVVAGTKSVFDALVLSTGVATTSLAGWTYAINQQVSTQAQQTQVITDMANSMGAYLVPSLASLQQTGESLADTAVRLTDEIKITDAIASLMGKDIGATFGQVGVASLAMRDSLIKLMGGVSTANSTMQSYYTNFLTSAQQNTIQVNALSKQFMALGLVMPTTREGFVNLANSQDLSTASGQQLYASLMALNGAFAAAVPAVSALRNLQIQLLQAQGDTAAATAAQRFDALAALPADQAAIQRQIYAAQDLTAAATAAATAQQALTASLTASLTTLISQGQAIKNFTASLGITGSGLTLAAAKTQYQADLAAANSGDATALGALPSSASAYITSALSTAKSATDQARIVASVTNALNALAPAKQMDMNVKLLKMVQDNTSATASAVENLDLLGIKAIFDVSQIISFVANSAGIPPELMTLITKNSKLYQVILNAALSSATSDPMKQLLISGANNYVAIVNAAMGTSDPAAQKLAITGTGTYLTMVNAALGITDASSRQLALTQANAFLTTVSASLSTDSATQSLRTLLSGTGTGSIAVSGMVTFDPSNPMQSVFNAIQNSGNRSAFLLSAIADNQINELAGITSAIGAADAATAIKNAATYQSGITAGVTNAVVAAKANQRVVDAQIGAATAAQFRATYGGYSDSEKIISSQYISANNALNQLRSAYSSTYGVEPSFAVGTNYVPNDMNANIHEGERIVPKADNIELMARLRNPFAGNIALIAEIRNLRSEVSQLRSENQAGQVAIATNTGRTALIVDRWNGDGMPPVRA